MHHRRVTELLVQTLYHGICDRFTIGTVNAAGLSDSDLDTGAMLLSEIQDCIFDAALCLPVNLGILRDRESKSERTRMRR